MTKTTARSCTCSHAWQDSTYGSGMRVHNYSDKAFNGQGGWRCTVCGTLKQAKKRTQPPKQVVNSQ